jgi:dolichyl-phosphate-mannose--protein O-mannosyl transferase
VTALGNPIIWWAALLALPYQLWRWVAKRDWRSGAVLVGVLAGWGPWLIYLERTIFTFYTVVYAPFVMMAVAMTLGDVLGPADASPRRRQTGIAVVAAFLVLVILAAWWFYPIWTGQVIPYEQWRMRMWFQSWV